MGRHVVDGAAVVLLLLGAFVAGRASSSRNAAESADEERNVYRAGVLTSPYLELGGVENGDPSMVQARDAARAFIEGARRVDPSLRVSLYVRDLERGHWVGIDSHERYIPSSLTKVAILLHTLSRAEREPGLLDREVVFPGRGAMLGDDSMGNAPDSLRMVVGQAYPVRDLLRRMIAFSDNHASQLLMDGQRNEEIGHMLYNLSAEQSFVDGQYLFDAHTVAALFRTLYTASYLGRSSSEFALDLLTKNFYRDGLRRFLPPELTVASKFGFHESGQAPHLHHQLHECGIVYRPQAPYVICVMTKTDKGTPEELDLVLGEVSRIVWAHQSH